MEFKGLKIDDSVAIPPLAKNLIEQLCSLKPSSRYNVDQALRHPWITGNPNDEIPMTSIGKVTQAMVNFELDDKLRRMVNLVAFLSIMKRQDEIGKKLLKVNSSTSASSSTPVQPDVTAKNKRVESSSSPE
jgi:serine/threonine protein kinase